jgi:hypothetical protein
MWEAQSTCRPHRWAPALGSRGAGIRHRRPLSQHPQWDSRNTRLHSWLPAPIDAGASRVALLLPLSLLPVLRRCGRKLSTAAQPLRHSRPTGAASPGAMLRDTSRAEPLTPCPAAPARAGPARRVWLAPRGLALQELPAGQRPSAPLDTQRGGRAGHQLGQEQQRQQQRGGRRRRQQCRRQLRSCGGGQLQAMRVAGARTSPAAVPALVLIDVCRARYSIYGGRSFFRDRCRSPGLSPAGIPGDDCLYCDVHVCGQAARLPRSWPGLPSARGAAQLASAQLARGRRLAMASCWAINGRGMSYRLLIHYHCRPSPRAWRQQRYN